MKDIIIPIEWAIQALWIMLLIYSFKYVVGKAGICRTGFILIIAMIFGVLIAS